MEAEFKEQLSTERANERGAPPTAPYDGGKTTLKNAAEAQDRYPRKMNLSSEQLSQNLFLQPSFHSIRSILSFFAATFNIFSQPVNRVAGKRAKNTGE
jgi:energy-converting hydrogenase Eha subunit F